MGAQRQPLLGIGDTHSIFQHILAPSFNHVVGADETKVLKHVDLGTIRPDDSEYSLHAKVGDFLFKSLDTRDDAASIGLMLGAELNCFILETSHALLLNGAHCCHVLDNISLKDSVTLGTLGCCTFAIGTKSSPNSTGMGTTNSGGCHRGLNLGLLLLLELHELQELFQRGRRKRSAWRGNHWRDRSRSPLAELIKSLLLLGGKHSSVSSWWGYGLVGSSIWGSHNAIL
jgi:hypothetical protein